MSNHPLLTSWVLFAVVLVVAALVTGWSTRR
jgi:hypothetical protein